MAIIDALQHAKEDVLRYVFSLGGVAQDRVGDTEEERRVGVDEVGESYSQPVLAPRLLRVRPIQRQCQTENLERRHRPLLKGQTREVGFRSDYFREGWDSSYFAAGISFRRSVSR